MKPGINKKYNVLLDDDICFVLNAIIQKILNEKGRLYCAFIDFRKAFDSVYLNGLWFKLYKFGINGKLLTIIRDMYNNVKTCVRNCNSLSDFFECAFGLKQGEVISPLLFSLFIEDLELFLQGDLSSGLCLDDITFILMIFADDMVILGKDANDLQKVWTFWTYIAADGVYKSIRTRQKSWFLENVGGYGIMKPGLIKAPNLKLLMSLIT